MTKRPNYSTCYSYSFERSSRLFIVPFFLATSISTTEVLPSLSPSPDLYQYYSSSQYCWCYSYGMNQVMSYSLFLSLPPSHSTLPLQSLIKPFIDILSIGHTNMLVVLVRRGGISPRTPLRPDPPPCTAISQQQFQ